MANVLSGLTSGLLAGAAGATALNAFTYTQQAIQGTPSSATPDQAAQAVLDKAGTGVPGNADERQNRLEGMGPLAGYGVGVAVGAVAGAIRASGRKGPFWVAVAGVGLGAMAVSDSVMAALGISDPRSWTPTSVTQDALPHLAYGAVTVLALHRMIDPHTQQVS